MRPKNGISPTSTEYFRPEINVCPHCQSKLKFCHTVSRKVVSTLTGVKKIINMGYRCGNAKCDFSHVVYRSAEAESLSMKHTTYGMDVIALVGHLRFKEHKTRTEIALELNQRGIKTTDRNVQLLYERYALLLRASSDSYVKEVLEKVVEDHGGIVLSIDGVQPEKGNETLYVIREVLSGTIMAAKSLTNSAASELMEFIKPILEWNFPILGFVSDGQLSIRLAIESLAPTIPYQYCQYHYLKDIAKPVVEQDRKLKTSVKKGLRGIREIERKSLKASPLESEVVQGYTAAIRSVLLEEGEIPLNLPGQTVYEKTKAIHQSLKACLDQKGGTNPLKFV